MSGANVFTPGAGAGTAIPNPLPVSSTDGALTTIGTTTDSSATNTVIGRLKALIAALPAALGAGGGLKVDGSGTALPVSGTVTTTPPANASTNLAQVGGAAIAEGATTKAASIPVVQPTDINTYFNDSQTNLVGNTAFTGVTRATAGFSRFRAFAASDLVGVLKIQESRTGATWFDVASVNTPAGFTTGTILEAPIALANVRVVFTNTAGTTTTLEIDSALIF